RFFFVWDVARGGTQDEEPIFVIVLASFFAHPSENIRNYLEWIRPIRIAPVELGRHENLEDLRTFISDSVGSLDRVFHDQSAVLHICSRRIESIITQDRRKAGDDIHIVKRWDRCWSTKYE